MKQFISREQFVETLLQTDFEQSPSPSSEFAVYIRKSNSLGTWAVYQSHAYFYPPFSSEPDKDKTIVFSSLRWTQIIKSDKFDMWVLLGKDNFTSLGIVSISKKKKKTLYRSEVRIFNKNLSLELKEDLNSAKKEVEDFWYTLADRIDNLVLPFKNSQ